VGVFGGLFVDYYFSERIAGDCLLSFGNGFETYESKRLQELGVRIDSYTPRLVASFNAQWTPIYAKLNLLGMRVVHFDTSLTGGIGAFVARRTIYNDVDASPGADRFNRPLSVNIGLNQRYYARLWGYSAALRLEARDYLYLFDTLAGNHYIKHNWYFGAGISWFFDFARPKGKANG
jgi:outer membrane beta-barrel protein